jgi:hypothetical protein
MAKNLCITSTKHRVRIQAGLFMMTVASMLILSSYGAAMSQENTQADMGVLSGSIVGISNVNNMQVVTLRLGNFPQDTLNIFLNKDAKFQVCNESRPLAWTEGREATVTYHELGGLAIADSIYEKC